MTARDKFNRAAQRQKVRRARLEAREAEREAKAAASALEPGEMVLRRAAERYGRSESGLQQACARGQLPSRKVGRNRVLKAADVEAYIVLAKELKRQGAIRSNEKRREKAKACPGRDPAVR